MVKTDLRIAVIADDFTGAMDTGVMFANEGLHTEFLLSQQPPSSDIDVIVISTDSRGRDQQSAVAAIKETASRFDNRTLFKKIDSTMRGHIAAEIETLLQVTGINKALICPAAITAGRTVQNGVLYVRGIPLNVTAFAHDPHFPATTSQVQQRLCPSSSIHIDLSGLAREQNQVLERIQQSDAQLITFDAVTHQDLVRIAKIGIAGDYLLCGSMGLARAWMDALTDKPAKHGALPDIKMDTDKPLLIVTGSRHPATARQIKTLSQHVPTHTTEITGQFQLATDYDPLASQSRQHQAVVLQTPDVRIDDPAEVNRIYALMRDVVQRLCDETALAGLVIIGGETAYHICQSLGATGIRILGEIESGVPVGQMIAGYADTLPIVTKAGGFGTDSTLCHVVDWLKQRD